MQRGVASDPARRIRSRLRRVALRWPNRIAPYIQLREWSEQARYLMAEFDQAFVDERVVPELLTVREFGDLQSGY
jgi:hypothetical protein